MDRKEEMKELADSRSSESQSDLIDAVLLADGKEFPVHKLILSLKSEYFKTFFKSSLNTKVGPPSCGNEDGKTDTDQAKTDKTERSFFKIDQDPEVLEKILQYVYMDENCAIFVFAW